MKIKLGFLFGFTGLLVMFAVLLILNTRHIQKSQKQETIVALFQ